MAHKLDDLFREKLHQTELTPSMESWSKVQQQIQPKKKTLWMPLSIAAAVVLLLAATVVILTYERKERGAFIAQVDHPALWETAPAIAVPTRTTQADKKVQEPVSKPLFAAQKQDKTEQEKAAYEIQAFNELQMIATVKLEANLETNTSLVTGRQPKAEAPGIKIIYIAENEVNPKEKLNEMWTNLSREVSPSGLLADIRDAKNSLFSRN